MNAEDCEYTASTAAAKLLQSCPTLCNPIDGSPSDSAVPGILQARTLEWVANSFSSVSILNPLNYILSMVKIIHFMLREFYLMKKEKNIRCSVSVSC